MNFNKCIKVTLIKCLNYDYRKVKQIIKDFQYKYSKAYNMATNYLYLWDTNSMNLKNLYDTKIVDKELLGKSKGAWIENRMNEIIEGALSNNVAQARQDIINKYNKCKKDGLFKGKVSLPTYKLDSKVIVHNVAYKLRNHNGYFIDIGLLNKGKQKELNVGRFEFQIDKLDGNKKATINKIINGEYKQGSAQISISKKGKIELIISYSFDKEEIPVLDNNRILGIDLGITNVATMSVYDSIKDEYDYFSWKTNVIRGKELIAFRQKYYNLRRDISIASKTAGKGRCGHGYKTKMKPVDKVRNRIANFADTYNHKISKYIVEFAVKNRCGIIQMEDLSGATSEVHNKMLKDWSYYDLQQKIEYKAKEQGIEIKKVNPKYTSKRCNNCGCIHEDNRDCKNHQARFECKVCGHGKDTDVNADVNASRNIAIPDIDKIIEETEILHSENKPAS
ncbi:transposase, IS605 OrfB family, central region [Clostridium paraputrificum]|uniref:RNA-guided endonuclease TnpB family protein n=1 Tax=Clostridium paraputrificum TaxID=29363 RepID=UPI000D85D22C|nr:RNA-guided endonuclease TnpB family protein [Clostridium paraputrificum]SQB99753.1 transposase, IS605 OrfB family, central region [Clostridium paraputrificum]